MNNANLNVLTNIIGAVESGGQVYGKRNYAAYAAPYTNSPKEVTITLGWPQFYGGEAYTLVSLIYAKDPAAFDKIDAQGKIKTMINGEHDWVAEKWSPSTYQRYILLALIDSQQGHAAQDELFAEQMKKYISDCEKTYTGDVRAGMMYCEIRHLGGKSAADRIFRKCGGNYSLERIMSVLKADQSDESSDNQVGDRRYWSRHCKCKQFIEKYAVGETAQKSTLSAEKCTDSAKNNVKTAKNGSASPGKGAASSESGITQWGRQEGKAVADLSFILTDFSKYTGMISNSGSDERGKYSGGKAGDQTGREWQIRAWYNRPWNYVLRYPDEKVRDCIATLAIEAANNNLIGYDQNERTTYWEHLKASGYRPSKITVACEADCSAGVAANVKAAGYLLGLPKLQAVSEDCYTGNLRAALKNAGFTVLADKKYTGSTVYLLPGDILLYEGHHTATNLGVGSRAKSASAASTSSTKKSTSAAAEKGSGYMFEPKTIRQGSKNTSVLLAQEILKARGLYTGSLDQDFGSGTKAAVIKYQKARGLDPDGCVGSKTWKDMIAI